MRSINATTHGQAKLILSGRKDEVVARLAHYIVNLIAGNKKNALAAVVDIVNANASRKVSWSFINDTIMLNHHRLEHRTIYRPTSISTPAIPVFEDNDQVRFKCSVFFEPMIKLTTLKLAPASQERKAKLFQFMLTPEQRDLLALSHEADNRPQYQIRFFCAKAGDLSAESFSKELLVEFPSICELRINGSIIGGSTLRGLRNRPGTVNPPDLTVMIKKHALNNVELVYINSESAYIAGIYMVKRTPISTLLEGMNQREIPKERVLKDIQDKQEEDDVVMESQTLSMKCPLAFTRIVTPIRSTHCNHLQCFDAHTFLLMNEQTPTWSCPVCYKRIENCEDLVLDGYFMEILKNTPKHIDSVRVEPNGHITIVDEHPSMDEEDDSEQEIEHLKKEETVVELLDDDSDNNTSIPPNNHDNTNKRPRLDGEADTELPLQRQNTAKKIRQNVIDLTLSSDEEEEESRHVDIHPYQQEQMQQQQEEPLMTLHSINPDQSLTMSDILHPVTQYSVHDLLSSPSIHPSSENASSS
ncbi:hypothetical protein RMATCC62417_00485 [Rhizopus microsporus]|nr:hypothetical protein RMATCC62417_00485 [Rhizopus microsporus]